MLEEGTESDLKISDACTFFAMLIHRRIKWKPEIETYSNFTVENERAKSCMQIQVICFEITGVQLISTPAVPDSHLSGAGITL